MFVIHLLKMRQNYFRLNLTNNSIIISFMLKRFSHFFASLLLMLMPLQGIAAANMSICNSLMQSSTQQDSQTMKNMPCHDMNSNTHGKHPTCKASCAKLCASLNAMTTLPSNASVASFLALNILVQSSQQTYVSVTQPSLQRPPILLS